jgi:hypothetical protein
MSRSTFVVWVRCALVVIAAVVFMQTSGRAQNVRLDNFGKNFTEKPVKVGGGISASGVFYDGNDGQDRQPFTYFLSGNVNVNFLNQINLPFSFNFTNLGSNYGYPTLPRRLSVHPQYKWVTGHIGDVAMSFSPYTLNGHMFTGVGVDLAPPNVPLKISAMYGRLQRAVEFDTAHTTIPASYRRMGYGAKVRYDQEEYFLGWSFLSAKDDATSLDWPPDSLNILPQANTAFSWEAGIKVVEGLNITVEYGLSLLTRDVRSPREGSSVFHRALSNRMSTYAYNAYKADLTYQFMKNTVGVGYERIDPDYKTLGAYFFNNDLENVTLKYARPLFKDKVTVAASWGVQRDDLDHNKEQSSKRFVSSANISYTPNDRFNTSLSYSSFQTYMNIRSQFDYINGQTPYDNLDTLDFTQLSQNMALTVTYDFSRNENRRQNVNANLSFQEAADKQGDVIRPGALSRFYNLSTAYSLLFVPEAVQLNAAVNTTFNHVGGDEFLIIGPTVGARAKVFSKKVTMGLSVSYNKSYTSGVSQGDVTNVRYNVAYVFLKKHNLNANAIWQQRDLAERAATQSVTATVGYAYSF